MSSVCVTCSQQRDLVDLIQIGSEVKCAVCIKAQRQLRLDNWDAVKDPAISACQTKLVELQSISVLSKVDMLAKLAEIQDCLMQMKYYCEKD